MLAVFVAFGVLSRLTRPDGTGRAVGGGGCEGEDPETRADLVAELDGLLGDRAAWILPAAPTNGDWSAFPQAAGNPISDAKLYLERSSSTSRV